MKDDYKMENLVNTVQEQATGAWIDYLNQLRRIKLIERLKQQDINLEDALGIVEEAKIKISEEVIERNRGGKNGMHGFIAERMQVYFKNARNVIEGKKGEYFLIDDNGPDDYWNGSTPIQQKFVQKYLGLDAIKTHFEKYPDFLKRGGKYQLPKDYYDRIVKLANMSEKDASLLDKESRRLYKYIKQFFDENEISINDIESTVIDYKSAQVGRTNQIIEEEKKRIREVDNKERGRLYQESKANLQEGIKVTAISAVAEGGVIFGMKIYQKLKQGKSLTEFNESDWREVGINTVAGTGKGAIRGSVVYVLTNFTATPAAVATSLVTATFGILTQKIQMDLKKITKEEFLINSEVLALDVTVSAISALLGQTLIPIPVLGAVIGSIAGNFVYSIMKEHFAENEVAWIKEKYREMENIEKYLEEKYYYLVKQLLREFKKYNSLINMAFSNDVNIAFEGSIQLARYVGVKENRILKTMKDIDNYFG